MALRFNYRSAMTVYIYGLYDPRTYRIRYIGKTVRIKGRFSYHLNDRRNTHKGRWISSLSKIGMEPIMRVIEVIENDDDTIWPWRERYWISRAKECGESLTNLDDGGNSGFKKSPESVEKMRQSKIGTKHSDASKAKRSEAMKGRIVSEETRRKISESNKIAKAAYFSIHVPKCRMPKVPKERKPISEETRQKMRLAKLGKKQSPAAIEASHAPLRGLKRSEETKRKMSEAKRAGWAVRKALQAVNA